MISPHDPKTIYYGGNHLFKSTDRGDTWTVLGEDLTTNADRDKMVRHGQNPWPAMAAFSRATTA